MAPRKRKLLVPYVGGCSQKRRRVEAQAEADQPDSELTAYVVVMWLALMESI